jgi:hypothetical protein
LPPYWPRAKPGQLRSATTLLATTQLFHDRGHYRFGRRTCWATHQ